MTKPKPDIRRRELGKIHLLAKQAGMGDDAYRLMLREVAGVDSAAKLSPLGRGKVLNHLARITGQANRTEGRPTNLGARPLLRKIEALLADAGRPWAYVTGGGKSGLSMVKRLAGVDRLEFADDAGLLRIVQALEVDKRRRNG